MTDAKADSQTRYAFICGAWWKPPVVWESQTFSYSVSWWRRCPLPSAYCTSSRVPSRLLFLPMVRNRPRFDIVEEDFECEIGQKQLDGTTTQCRAAPTTLCPLACRWLREPNKVVAVFRLVSSAVLRSTLRVSPSFRGGRRYTTGGAVDRGT